MQDDMQPQDAAGIRLLALATLTPWVVFLLFSPITKIQPNWPAVAVLTGTILLVAWLAGGLHAPRLATRRWTRIFIAGGALYGGGTALVIHRTEWLMPVFGWLARGAPPWEVTPVAKYDFTARLRGWRELGAAVGDVLAAERAAGRNPFIMADSYQVTSEIAFYCPGQPNVYSAQSAVGTRSSQYDLWPNPVRDAAAFIGRPCIYVGSPKPELTGESGRPAALPGMRPVRTVEHRVGGYPVQIWPIFICERFVGFQQ